MVAASVWTSSCCAKNPAIDVPEATATTARTRTDQAAHLHTAWWGEPVAGKDGHPELISTPEFTGNRFVLFCYSSLALDCEAAPVIYSHPLP